MASARLPRLYGIAKVKTPIRPPNRLVGTVLRYQRLVSGFSNWPLQLAAKWGWLGKNTLLLRTRSGWQIEIPWRLQHTFKEIFLYGSYLHPHLLARLPESPVVVDVGGNVGFFSLFALDLRPGARCFTFEPMKGNFAQLQRNHQLNPKADWRLFQAAVAGKDGTVQIYSPSGQPLVTDAFIGKLRESSGCASGTSDEVAACTLETMFAREGIQHCDWLKLDCEGAEYEILYGAPASLFDRISAITMETHLMDGAMNTTEAISDYLEQLGYDIWLTGDIVYALKRG